MPTYQYACTACDHRFEAVQRFSESSLTDCPECQGRLRKLFSSVGIVFKGSGFYRTDSRSGTGEGSASTVKAESGGSEKKSEAGTAKSGESSSSGSSSSGGNGPGSSTASTSTSSGTAKAAATS
ncbi:putative FmdB family regulatory protein [Actinoalloteichus hoggarensis]|uniref:Zinc ribbon domain protein n=1 Tax=Actinoalloteichus hoggarensis TaxID=1470176 RepID=A0A221VXJ7_9PSEU|nr:FmdB family zinc ribbon protein [Actinoalloteichus hoggarensis]ASO18280.1 Zinc ribbon domain protein [Actinoalloteichus hoggarensis]MBB5921642.1 putative FmdB family regulatory protein [Actinoalloteichus hoggarensis]